MASSSIDLDQDPCAILATREFDAPRELVFCGLVRPKTLGTVVGAEWL